MDERKNVRRASVMVGALAILAGVAGLVFVTSGAEAPAEESVLELTGEGVCPADGATTDGVEDTLLPPGGNPCKDCKNSPDRHRCTRISCDPCCWACIGEPLPICSS